jgi:fumarate reductase subunit C
MTENATAAGTAAAVVPPPDEVEDARFYARWYRPRIGRLWWLRRRSYLVFVLRELTSVFVAWFVVFLLLLAHAISAGPAQYQRFLDLAGNPWMIALNVIALGFVVFHTITWFALAPQAIVVRLRGRRVPGRAILGLHYLAWLTVSGVLAWVILR